MVDHDLHTNVMSEGRQRARMLYHTSGGRLGIGEMVVAISKNGKLEPVRIFRDLTVFYRNGQSVPVTERLRVWLHSGVFKDSFPGYPQDRLQ